MNFTDPNEHALAMEMLRLERERQQIELVNATQDEVDAGDGGLRLVGPDDPRHSSNAR